MEGHDFIARAKTRLVTGLPPAFSPCLALILLALFLSTPAKADTAAETFKRRCAPCHAANGSGDTMIGKNLKIHSLTSDEIQKRSDDQLFTIISKGKNKMPAFDHKLSRDQIKDLIKHIRSLKR